MIAIWRHWILEDFYWCISHMYLCWSVFSHSRFVYETEHFNGVGELLEILGR